MRCVGIALYMSGLAAIAVGASAGPVIVTHPSASPQEVLAAREVVRYLYLRTGRLLPVIAASKPPANECIVIGTKERQIVRRSTLAANVAAEIDRLKPQEYLMRTLPRKRGTRVHLLIGGDKTGTLYAAYRYAELLGVRFYLHGDTIPDRRMALRLPTLDETGKPLFALRGIQPFHDFPEGPDWWNRDDYLSYTSQLPKLRMNFFGLHTYPEGGVGPEPGVWIGLAKDVGSRGKVEHAYAAAWANTARKGMWGYAALPTSQFSCGAAGLFESDAFGPDIQAGSLPAGQTPGTQRLVFDRTGLLLHDAFAQARALGVKTCIGTETPLTIPKAVQDRLKQEGIDPASREAAVKLYEGMFTRIARAHPSDYYWLWTPEDWTWSGNTADQFARTVGDIRAAYEALEAIRSPMQLATCGWVLGPQNDRAALHRDLPRNVPVSTINQQVGHAPVERAFESIKGRPKWAIPWMENDPSLTAPQLWAGRMRYDATEARLYGCNGLFGIHWRTKILAPTVSALAGAGWDQSWVPALFPSPDRQAQGADGGHVAAFNSDIANTDEQAVYRTVRYGMQGYSLAVPSGIYSVTLKFAEPHYTAPGKRVFGVTIQGRPVLDSLDVFARVGPNRALDFTYRDIAVTDGRLRIGFTSQVEYPCIAGIVVEGALKTRKIDCGGPGWQDYESDSADKGSAARKRSMPVHAFYVDFAVANFGPVAARAAGRIFRDIDGASLPEPATWVDGPGNIKIDPTPWEAVNPRYAFVDSLARIRPRVLGAGNLERFDYWLNTFRFMRSMAYAGCLRGKLDIEMNALKGEKDVSRKAVLAESALATRVQLTRAWDEMMGYLLRTVSTPGEMGTVADLEQHVRTASHFLDFHDFDLAAGLGHPLPASTGVNPTFSGAPRLIVPTVRGLAAPGESLRLKAIVLGAPNTARVAVQWRQMGRGAFRTTPMSRVARGVYTLQLPPISAAGTGIEYSIHAQTGSSRLVFPATAPALNQTVVVSALVPR